METQSSQEHVIFVNKKEIRVEEANLTGSQILVIFRNYQLPLGIYNREKTDLMIFTTPYYPNAGFDMFWVDDRLLLKNNSIPQGANSVENYLGRNWRRFSYHPYSARPWNPGEDSILTFMQHVEQRLRKGD